MHKISKTLLTLGVLPGCALLAACTAPAPQSGAQSAPAAIAAPFTVPMDPGQISCGQLGNPAALDAATDWALGQARAGVLSGRVAAVPDTPSLAGDLARYCSANGTDTVRMAIRQLGL